MGVERAVTRWYLHRQSLLNDIEQLEARLAQVSESSPEGEALAGSSPMLDLSELLLQLANARERLLSLGPCPKPMMG